MQCLSASTRGLRASQSLLRRPKRSQAVYVRAEVDATKRRTPVLNLLSSAVAVEAQVQRFETLAGRSAMIGFIMAAVAELSSNRSLFYSITADEAGVIGAAALTLVSAASILAFIPSAARAGVGLREAVLCSLTAVQRSAASVSDRQVDGLLDYVFDKHFGKGMIDEVLVEDEMGYM